MKRPHDSKAIEAEQSEKDLTAILRRSDQKVRDLFEKNRADRPGAPPMKDDKTTNTEGGR